MYCRVVGSCQPFFLDNADVEHPSDKPTIKHLGFAAGAIDLGLGKTALAISTGYFHTCALLNDNSLKCSGYGYGGYLGFSNAADVLAAAVSPIVLKRVFAINV
jgi:hypothetical protein